MKIFTFSFKSLLIAAGLLMGSANAWGESQIFSEDFSGPSYNVTWGGTSQGGVSPAVADGALKVANGSASGDRSAYVAFGSNAYTGCCRLIFDMGMTKSEWSGKNNNFYVLPSATTDRYPSTTNAALIVTQDYNGAITIAGESVGTYDGTMLTYDLYLNTVTGSAKVIVKNGETTLKTISYNTTATGINTLHLNFNKNKGAFAIDNISFYSLTAPDFSLSDDSKTVTVDGSETVNVTGITGDVSVVSKNTSIATASYSAGVITINGVATGVTSLTVTATNDGLTIEKEIEVTVGDVATTTVTVNYLCGETPIAEALELTDVTVGSVLTASDITYDEVIYGSGVRYVNPTPDQTIPYTVVEDGVININYASQAAVTNVKKIVKAGDVTVSSTDVAQDGKYVGDVINFSFPTYINYNGTLYNKDANNKTYSQSFTLTATDQECILAYTATDITNVVYFSEGESVTGATSTSAGSNMSARSSNQACGYAESDITLINVPAGEYRMSGVMYSNSSAGLTLNFKLGEEAYNPNVVGSSNWYGFSQLFTLTSAADVKWLTSGSNTSGLDYVYIQKVAEPVTITAAGYATFSSSYPLDLTTANTPSGLTAYYIDKDDLTKNNAPFTAINQTVAASEGILLKGAEGIYNIKVATTGTALTDNALVATNGTAIAAGNYVFAYETENPSTTAGFYYVSTETAAVAAGKAYLDGSKVPSAAKAFIFGDTATEIEATPAVVEAEEPEVLYNMAGQIVGKDYKGIVINQKGVKRFNK